MCAAITVSRREIQNGIGTLSIRRTTAKTPTTSAQICELSSNRCDVPDSGSNLESPVCRNSAGFCPSRSAMCMYNIASRIAAMHIAGRPPH